MGDSFYKLFGCFKKQNIKHGDPSKPATIRRPGQKPQENGAGYASE